MDTKYCTCETCSGQFKFRKSKSNKFCSIGCYRVAQRSGKYNRGSGRIHECAHCKKVVVGVSKSKKRDGTASDNVFCDRGCYNDYRTEIKSKKVGSCKHCSKAMLSGDVSRMAVYCSWDCRLADKRAKPKNCISCGCFFTAVKFIKSRKAYIGISSIKSCSYKCYIENIKNNKERKQKISDAFTGDKHPNWQGGAPVSNRGYRGHKWQKYRERALKRDGYKCIRCNMTQAESIERNGRSLEVNHIIPFWQFQGDNSKANKLSNLETLCRSCHMKAEWEYRRSNHMQKVLPFG